MLFVLCVCMAFNSAFPYFYYLQKDEMNPSSEKEDRNYHQVRAKEGPSHKLRKSAPVQTNATCNKARETASMMSNTGNSGSLLEMVTYMVSRAGQTCKNCTSEKADSAESSGEINKTCVSVHGENRNGASTLKKRIEISKMSKCIDVSCQNTQHLPPEMTQVKAKPKFSLRRDLTILPNRTADGEHQQMLIDNTDDVSRQTSYSRSLDRRIYRLMKSRKEDVQECKRSSGGFNVPLTKTRLVKDVSSREPAHSKSHNLSRSLSPSLIIKEHSQQAISKERRAKDYKSLKADLDPSRQNQHHQRRGSSGSKTTVVSARPSKFKLEFRQTEENKTVAYKTEIGVTRVEDPVLSAASSHSGSPMNTGKARRSSPLPSPASAASSMSDTYVSGPKHRPQTTGRTRQNAPERIRIEKCGVSTAECHKKANVLNRGDAHNKREINDNVSGLPKNSFSGRDLKSETPPTADSGKQDLHQRIHHRNPKQSGSAVSQQQISKDRKPMRSLKLNSSVKASDGIMNINKLKIAANRGSGFPRASMEENKQVKIPSVKLTTIGCSNTSEALVSPQKFREKGNGKSPNTKERVDKTENEISDASLTHCLLKAFKKISIDPSNPETHACEIVDQSAPSTNLVSLDTLVQAVSSEQLSCPLSRNDTMLKSEDTDVKDFQSDVTNVDFLPAIYFCWQKCTDQQTEERSPQQDVQHVVSLDQGLSVLRKIMMDAISENRQYSQEYTLKQLISKEAKHSSNHSLISNNDKDVLLAGTCFQLTPRFKGTKSNQVVWSAESIGGSTLIGSFPGDGASFIQESKQTMLCPVQGDSGPLDPALGEALCGTNDIKTAINISKAIRNSIQRRMSMTSLWSSVTKGIIAFFLHPLEKPSIGYSDLGAETIDDSGTTVDALISFLDKGQSSHAVGQKTGSLGQVTLEQTKSPCSNLVTGKRLSSEKGIWNNDTSSKDKQDSSCTSSITKSCENTEGRLQDPFNSFGESCVECSHACGTGEVTSLAEEMEILEPSHSFPEHIPVVRNTDAATSHVVEFRFNNYRKDTTIGENFTMNKTSKEFSHCNYSNKRIEKSMHSEKADINEINNIPFSTNMYESLEGPTKKPDCNSVFQMRNDFVLRAYHSDELEFLGPYENCPDPDVCDLENNADVDVGARPSCYDTCSFRHYPHLMWTRKYCRSMMDSEEQPVSDSKCCTAKEHAELYDGNWQLHKTDQSKYKGSQDASVHIISCKGYFHEQGVSAQDTSVDGFNCYISTDSPCQDVCHRIVSQKYSPRADDNLLEGNIKASSQHKTSPYILNDVMEQDGSNVYVADDCGIIHKQPLSCSNIEVAYSPSEADDGIKRMRHFGVMNAHKYGRNCNLMENSSPHNINVQINHDDLFDEGGFFGEDYCESACRQDDYTTCIDGDKDSFDAYARNTDDCVRERNHDDGIYEINSPKTQTTVTSRTIAEPAVNKLTEYSKSADVGRAILNADCKQNSSDVALLFKDQHGCFSDSLPTHDTSSNTLETITGTIVSPRQQSGQNISTDDIVTVVSEGSVSGLTRRKPSRQFLSIDSITRAALALKQASTAHMSNLCSSHTATACLYLIRVGCSNPFVVTLSNLFTQQLFRNSQREMLNLCSSSVDARALDWKTEDAVESRACGEDGHNRISNDSLECAGVNSDFPKLSLCTGKYKHNELEFAPTSSDSSQLANVRQGHQENTRKVRSLKERACTLPKTISRNIMGRATNKTATARRFSSLGTRTASRTTRPSSKRNNNSSNSSQKKKNKSVKSDPYVSRITDTLPPNTRQSDEGQESGIFSNFSLASPPASRAARLDKANSSSESFESVFKRNSIYLKELTSEDGPGCGQPKAD